MNGGKPGYICAHHGDTVMVEVGIDFGGTGSKNTFVASGYTKGMRDLIILQSVRIEEDVNDEQLKLRFVKFVEHVYNKYKRAFDSYYDNAEPVLGRGLGVAVARTIARTNVKPCLKIGILQRIRLVNSLMAQHRFWILNNGETETVKEALYEAVWDPDEVDTRLDDGTSDIDTLDAMEYSFEHHHGDLIKGGKSLVLLKREENNKKEQ